MVSPVAMTAPSDRRRASTVAAATPATVASIAGSIHSAAAGGPSPATSCRYCAVNSITPTRANMVSELTASGTATVLERSSPGSISGWAERAWRRANSAPAASPDATATGAAQPGSSSASSFTPYTTGSTAASESATPARSSLPGAGSRCSGTSSGAATSSASITGVLSRNTDPHQKRSSRNPPAIGPTIAPPEKPAAQIPTAVRRWSSSWNIERIRARVEGARVAPATPSTARAAMSICGVVA